MSDAAHKKGGTAKRNASTAAQSTLGIMQRNEHFGQRSMLSQSHDARDDKKSALTSWNELSPKVAKLWRVLSRKKFNQMIPYHVGVIVGLEKKVGLGKIVLVNVHPRKLGLGEDEVAALWHSEIQHNCR
jgi:hypothetical protein